jgi:hypothetical protein
MFIARADRETETAVMFRRRVEIADGVNDVIKTAGH